MRTSVSTGAAAEDNLGLNRGWLGGWMGKGICFKGSVSD